MKCVFDGQLKSEDTILMNLYKRVFPKWTYEPFVNAPPSLFINRLTDERSLEYKHHLNRLTRQRKS
ncbi:unnamed protein product [Timema podura]|uniref:Ribosome biogenesis protein BMS1/TSR1 C-terminal domain-containing protein n=1 Tax=Timema podura TaxID=61482 RepID=A0ABN7PNW2_TIMPD|nr:unnamed protein product [Timema podura]